MEQLKEVMKTIDTTTEQTDAGPQLDAGYATYARLGCNLAGDMTGVETDDGHLEGTSIQVVALVC